MIFKRWYGILLLMTMLALFIQGQALAIISGPTVTSISPSSGTTDGGTAVTITGAGFAGLINVSFGGTSASFDAGTSTDTVIYATSPPGAAATVDITITTADGGTSPTSAADQFTYTLPPVVTGLSQSIGPVAGGNVVSISGSNFTGTTVVKFGNNAATVLSLSSEVIYVIVPAGSTGTVDITVTTPVATSATSAAAQYTYTAVPTVSGLRAGQGAPVGPLSGGTVVTIYGFNFTGATAVKFGSSSAAGFTVNSDSQISAVSPAGSAGTIDITVTGPGGTSATNPADKFIYTALPVVTGISTSIGPQTGPVGGGSAVTIRGFNFAGATAVKFGSSDAASFIVNSDSQISAVSPAGSAGTIGITVTTPAGTSNFTPFAFFTYTASPHVSSISPPGGVTAGGTAVTITGFNFTGATAVQFGGNLAPGFHVDSDTKITVTSPPGSEDTVPVTVSSPAGTGNAYPFIYDDHTIITSISQDNGPTAGGTPVIISGINFTGVTAVKFGTIDAAGYTVDSASQITATSPPSGAASTVGISVTTSLGISNTSRFTFNNAYGTADGTYDFGGLGAYDSMGFGTGYARLGDKFKVGNSLFSSWPSANVTNGPLTAIYTSQQPIVIKAEGGVICKTFTFQDLGVSAYTQGASFSSFDIVLKDISGVQIGSTISLGISPVISTTSVINLSTLYSQSPWPVDGVAAIEIAYTLSGKSGTPIGAGDLNLENLTLANVRTTPVVTGIIPASGPAPWGTAVTITGKGLIGATAVKFGTVAAGFTIDSDTQITAISPASSAGVVDITVVTPLGTSAATSADQFAYTQASLVISTPIDPSLVRDGIISTVDGKTAPDLGDVLAIFQYTLGGKTLTADQLAHADVAPLGIDGRPQGNGVVDIADVIMVLRRVLGVVTW